MPDVMDEIRRSRLVILARGVEKGLLVEAVEALAEAGITLFESTFDHTAADPLKDNAEKIAAIAAAVGDRVAVGAPLATLEKSVDPDGLEKAAGELFKAFTISPSAPEARGLVIERVEEV